MLEYIEREMERAKSVGVNLTEAENLLAGARMLIESDELAEAAEIVGQCMQLASRTFAEHESLVRSIKKAETEVMVARSSGKDISEACNYLKQARECMERGDYGLGIASARNAVEALQKKAEIAWGSGLAGEG